jgi:hypothetical protein
MPASGRRAPIASPPPGSARAQRVGRQPDEGVGNRLGVGAGQRQRAPVPTPRQGVPAELAQEGTVRAVGQRDQPSSRSAAPQHRKVAIGAAVAALSPGRDGAQPEVGRRGRRRQRPAAGLGPEGSVGQLAANHESVTSFNHNDVVNTLWSSCYRSVNDHSLWINSPNPTRVR